VRRQAPAQARCCLCTLRGVVLVRVRWRRAVVQAAAAAAAAAAAVPRCRAIGFSRAII
jgi:hypothetical protein